MGGFCINTIASAASHITAFAQPYKIKILCLTFNITFYQIFISEFECDDGTWEDSNNDSCAAFVNFPNDSDNPDGPAGRRQLCKNYGDFYGAGWGDWANGVITPWNDTFQAYPNANASSPWFGSPGLVCPQCGCRGKY